MLELRYERMNPEEVTDYLKTCSDTFTSLTNPNFLKNYGHKLAMNADFIIGRNSGGDIGCIVAYYANQKPNIFLSHVHTISAYRGNGYLKRMLDLLIARNRNNGFDTIKLEVNKDNDVAIQAYKKLGFTIEEEKDQKFEMILKLNNYVN